MTMKRCGSGHYYDTGKHTLCPICSAVEIGRVAAQPAAPQPVPAPAPAPAPQAGRTVAVVKKETGIDPVVGWLVCVDGPDRGVDYRIKGEKNFIGRAAAMDIAVAHDDTISRENHAAISYNPKKRSFKILPGEARGLVYLNGDEVDAPRDLKRGDRVELGRTTLMFIPLCGDDFDWE